MWQALRSRRDPAVIAAALLAPLAATAALAPFRTDVQNTDVALVLVVVVVAVAAWGNRRAGALAAVSAAVWFDFFLTRPYDRLNITRTSDVETTVLIVVIGMFVTEIAVRARRQLASATRRDGYLNGLRAAAEAVAAGTSADALREQVTAQLEQLLTLQTCCFQYGIAGLGGPARLQHDGRVTSTARPDSSQLDDLPPARETELLVESAGHLQGRFLMTPAPGATTDLERRLVAVVLADQVGAAFRTAVTDM